MKIYIIIIILLFCFEVSNAEKISKQKIEKIQKDALKLKQNLGKGEYEYTFQKETLIEFAVDTFLIERELSLKMDLDYSTSGIIESIYNAEKSYDKLLNKYYQYLLKRLNKDDKESLKTSQKNWILFRDNERKLNLVLTNEEYNGGGSMQVIKESNRFLEITKTRVLELYHYLINFI